MNISQSGNHLLSQSTQLAEKAAVELNRSSVHSNTLHQPEIQQEASKAKPTISAIDPLIDLQRANQYSKVGATIIQREQDMIGTLLDTSV